MQEAGVHTYLAPALPGSASPADALL